MAGSSDVTLTNTDGQLNEARNATYEFTGALTGNISVIIPTSVRKHVVFNNTTGAFTLTVKTVAGAGIAVPQGKKMALYCDGTNVVEGLSAVGHLTVVGSIDESKGADIATAATTNIWATDGNYVVLTGNAAITSFGTAPRAGARRRCRVTGTPTLTNGANLICPTGANIPLAAGDVFEVYADTTAQHRVVGVDRADGSALTVPATITGNKAFTGTVDIQSTGAVNNLTVSSTDAGAVGPKVRGFHASASPAANDVIFTIESAGKDNAANDTEYGDLQHVITDPNNTGPSEDSEWRARATVAGVKTEILRFGADSAGTPGVQIGTPTGGYKGAGTINKVASYSQGVLDPISDVTIVSGTAHNPVAADHGKTFIYTNGATVTVTLPAVSGLPSWSITVIRQGAGRVDVVRNAAPGTDTIRSQGAGLATLSLPSASDGGRIVADSANGRFFFQGSRTFESTEVALDTGVVDTQAHNLGVLPRQWGLFARCKTADLNHEVGDEVQLCAVNFAQVNSTQKEISMDANNGVLKQGTGGNAADFRLLDEAAPGAASLVDTPDWRLFWRAWVIN